MLHKLHKDGRLDYAEFVFFNLMESDSEKYNYFQIMKNICDLNNWKYKSDKNHSKVLLFDTDAGKFVIETSSNLNENPKIEQFSFEQDEELYKFYMKEIFGNEV